MAAAAAAAAAASLFLFSELAACVLLFAEQCARSAFNRISAHFFLRLLCSGVALKRRLLPTRASKADFYFCALDKSVHCVRDVL